MDQATGQVHFSSANQPYLCHPKGCWVDGTGNGVVFARKSSGISTWPEITTESIINKAIYPKLFPDVVTLWNLVSQGVNWRLLHSLDLDRVIREGDVDMIQALQLPTASHLYTWLMIQALQLAAWPTASHLYAWLANDYYVLRTKKCTTVCAVYVIRIAIHINLLFSIL